MPACDVLVLADDLMWLSRISGAAQDLGLTWASAASVERLRSMLAAAVPRLVLVDLDLVKGREREAIESIRESATGAQLAAFGSHVDAEALRAAGAAGCAPVLTRSQLVSRLNDLLAACRR